VKSRWLLLGVSVLCLLLLFPAAALSQGHSVDAGCGTATIDGHVGGTEWATAAMVPLYEYELPEEDAPKPAGVPSAGVAPSQLQLGQAYFMNDGRFLYLGAILDDPNDDVTDDATNWGVNLRFAFEDEPTTTQMAGLIVPGRRHPATSQKTRAFCTDGHSRRDMIRS